MKKAFLMVVVLALPASACKTHESKQCDKIFEITRKATTALEASDPEAIGPLARQVLGLQVNRRSELGKLVVELELSLTGVRNGMAHAKKSGDLTAFKKHHAELIKVLNKIADECD